MRKLILQKRSDNGFACVRLIVVDAFGHRASIPAISLAGKGIS